MLCESCGKHEAEFHYKSNVNGKVTEKHLCSHCAKEQGYSGVFAQPSGLFGSYTGDYMSNMISGFFGGKPTLGRSKRSCPVCGATAREMAAAYAIFGNGGYYSEPYTYYQVTKGKDEDETVLLTGGQKSDPALDPQTAYVMVSLLQRVVKQGTAWNGVGQNWKDWPVFGKTGTSESNKDVYFAGGTPYYAAASWFGYDDNTIMIGTQTGHALKLWNLAMKAIHQNLQIKKFDRPSGVETLEYCTATGMLATESCKNTDKGVYKCKKDETGAIVGGFVPEYCTAHGGGPVTTTTTGAGQSSTSSAGGDTTSSASGSSTSQTGTSATGGETTTTATPGGATEEDTP